MKRSAQEMTNPTEEPSAKEVKVDGAKPSRKERKEKYKNKARKHWGGKKNEQQERGNTWLKTAELQSEVFEKFYREQKIMPE